VGIVKLLLEHPDVDVNVEDGDRRTPLWWAAEEGHDAAVRLLLKKGAALPADNFVMADD
jgi:serine/threonine-protein phosphatase 6 regulatory ankyrin repeat subunit A